MKRIGLAIAAAATGVTLAVSTASAAPTSAATNDSAVGLVHKVGGIYIDIGPPRYYGYGGYYDRPYYPSYGYGYYAPRYYRYSDGYYDRPYWSRRWVRSASSTRSAVVDQYFGIQSGAGLTRLRSRARYIPAASR